MYSKIAYPWFFFYRIARLSLVIFLPTLLLLLYVYRTTYKESLIAQSTTLTENHLRSLQSAVGSSTAQWINWCKKLPPNSLYTVLKSTGEVLCGNPQNFNKINGPEDFLSYVKYEEDLGAYAVFAGLKVSNEVTLWKLAPLASLRGDKILFFRVLPFAILSYLIFLYFFYRSSKPLGKILSKVENFKIDIPFKRNLELLYEKNEWARVEEALNETDQKLKEQVVQTQTENEKIAAILGSIHDDIIAIDHFETILFYNPNFKKNFIRERSDKELIPKIWHTFNDESVLDGFRSVLKKGGVITLRGMNFPSSHSPEKFFDLTITSLNGADGKINGALGVFYDVTDFKLTEQMRVDFVANVSHEIRTPLTSIKGYTQILESQKAKIDPALHLFLDKIISNTERMISLFNDLLNLSVIESKNMLKIEELNLSEIVSLISDNIITNYPHKKINIETKIEHPSIRGDQRLIEQVLTNLMDNACKYSGEELIIQVSSFKKENHVYIVVADNGLGISKEHVQRIFERFYRIDSSRESSRGAGLGLSIVKHIINKHGGRIWVESKENQGSTFVIELPA